jgi:Bacterial Ig-like domain (group 3)
VRLSFPVTGGLRPTLTEFGSTTLCTAILSGGVAACGATNAPAGTDTVTGTYSGGADYASSSGTATLTVK